MTKQKSFRRALLLSALSLLMCVSMLIGSTFAWFTDSVASGSNVITAGNLDIVVEYTLDGTNWNNLDGAGDLFQKGLWEPGHTEVVALRITNNGTLALKYVANMNITNETVGKTATGADIVLSDILTVSTLGMGPVADASEEWIVTGSLAAAFGGENGLAYENTAAFKQTNILGKENRLMAGETAYVFVQVDMAETVGNEANHNGINIPTIHFGINVLATQFTYENDSFGDQYDENADFVVYYTSGTHELNAVLKATKATDVITVEGENTVLNIRGGSYDAGDQDCAVWAKDGATVNIYDGTFTHNGDGTVATSAHHFDMIYAGANGGKINIYGGTYSAKSGGVWLLNEKDNQGTITVYGGTFVNWNPANNESEGKNTNFVADGYAVTTQYGENGDVFYIVGKKTSTDKNAEKVVVEQGAKVDLEDDNIQGTVTNNGGELTMTNTTVHNAADHSYGAMLGDGSYTSFKDATITNATGGGITLINGEAVFESGTINIQNTKSRHVFYVGTDKGFAKLTIKDGTFNLKNKTATSSYLVAQNEGAVIIIEGGNFEAASSKKAPVQEIAGGEVIIKGGTFKWDPTDWVAEGYQAVENNGVWTVSAI